LQGDNQGVPDGVNKWTTNVNPGVNPNAPESFWLDLELSPNVKLNGNTVYWIVASNGNNANSGYGWFEQENNPYSGGTGARMNPNPARWIIENEDLLFMVRGRYASRITGGAAGDELGFAVTSAGDINKDGKDDIAVGAPYAHNGNTADCGAVYTFLGPLAFNNAAANANYTNYGNATNDHFGWSVDGGDVNNDGYSELLVGAPGYDTPAQDVGQASIWAIPEFKDIIVPLFGTMIIGVLIQRKRRNKPNKIPHRRFKW
jgi:hypothetical protein